MADYYLRSVGGVDTNDGLSWATARATIVGVISLLVAGDTLYIAEDHVEGGSAIRTLTFPGTPALPNRVICAKVASNPPTEATNTGAINSSGGGNLTIQGSVVWCGVKFNIGSSGSSTTISLASSLSTDAVQMFDDCDVLLGGNGSSGVLGIGNANSSNNAKCRVLLTNTRLRLNVAGQQFGIQQEFNWRGGKLLAPLTAPPSFLLRVGAQGRGAPVLVEGVDLTELGAASDLVGGPQSCGRITFRNCSLPAGWTGQLVQGLIDPGLRVEMHNCDSIDTNYRMWVVGFNGSIRAETGVVKADGASDGVVGFSWKVATNANPTAGLMGLESPELARWNETVNAPITVGLDILSDGDLLTNADVWIEVQYAGNAGLPKSEFMNNRVAPLVAPTAHATSSATWNTSGMVKPRAQRLAVTFTPRKAGALAIKVTLAKPNAVLYVDPKVQVT